jgi:hypothetical protein
MPSAGRRFICSDGPHLPWQNPYAERSIGSCLNHVIVLSARHLRRIVSSYAYSCESTRTSPPIQGPSGANDTSAPPAVRQSN